MNVRYHELALQEIVDITAYYASIRPELGVAFHDELEAAVARIKTDPLQFWEYRRGIRCCLMDRFPYGIYYRISDAGTVRIIVVRHHARRPGYGMRGK